MIDGTWSLFVWSLKSDARTFYPHVIRAFFCLIIFITVLVAWGAASTLTSPIGLILFAGLCYTNVAVITVAGISYFVSAVTEEKDSGNLALLKLAGVSSLSIVLSKSFSRQIAAFALLIVQIPFTQLAVTLGGITPQQIFAAYLALTGWLLLVSNGALLCSVVCRTTGKAAALATIATLIFAIANPCLDSFLSLAGTKWMPPSFLSVVEFLKAQHDSMNIFARLQVILTSNAQVVLLAPQFTRSLLISLGLFTTSVMLFNRFSEESHRPEHGRRPGVRRILVNRAWQSAIAWKDFVFFGGGKTVWFVKLIAYVLVVLGFSLLQQLSFPSAPVPFSAETARSALITVVLFISLELLMYASNSLFLEMHHRTALDLLMLPKSVRSVLWQKTAAVLMSISPGIVVATILLVLEFDSISDTPNWLAVTTIWLVVTLFLVHLSMLLSLYLRWAAMPIAVFITILLSPVFAGAAVGTFGLVDATASASGVSGEAFLGAAFSLGWLWIFVLLPIQIEIAASWKRVGSRV